MKIFLRLVGAATAVAFVSTSPAAAATPAGRYTVTAQTVYDTKSRLTWQRTALTTGSTWDSAKTYCASSTVSAILGGAGRLPTIKELQTLVDYLANPPRIDLVAFPGTPGEPFWSSSAKFGSSSEAWVVDFSQGPSKTDVTSDVNDVRCVR